MEDEDMDMNGDDAEMNETMDEAPGNVAETQTTGAEGNGEDMINVNSATKEELMTVPGINERTAEAIIKYRDKIGGFNSLDDLSKVKELKKEHLQTLKKWVKI